MKRSARRPRGQAVVEAALILPLLLTVIMIGVDFGRLYASQVTVDNAARQASRYGASNPGDSTSASPCGQWSGSVTAAQNEAAGSPVSIRCSDVSLAEAGPDTYGARYVQASVQTPFSFVTPFLTPLLHLDHVTGSNTARELTSGSGSPGSGSCSPSYAGHAWSISTSGVKLGPLGLVSVPDTILGDSGTLGSSGGTAAYGGSLSVSITNLLTAQLLTSFTSGSGCYASSSSKVASVGIAPLGVDVVDMTVLTAYTAESCGSTPTQSSSVASVKVAGITVPVPIGTNQVVSAGGVTLTFNHQQPTANPPSVDAVSLNFPAGGPLSATITGTITVAHAEARC